ncbi:serpin family protein [Kibdelosporangium aridum]|uniref:Serpin family protein n=1 Tax=Kibdelosporangium aridum TaxID=2030 RepID=A0A428Z9K0_KIBAR|nr:serpin family protein [Kibdelosporangium aridum]RSM84739.1 serpin family protein [Kibdelosporangium aridum]
MAVSTRLSALGLILLVTACGAGAEAPAEPLPPAIPVAQQVSADVAELVAAMDTFGLDLLTSPTLADKPNLVLSPASASLALQMVGAGASGETAAQMKKVLHLPEGVQPRMPAFDLTDLKVANTVWAQQGLVLKPGFTGTLRDQFGAAMNEADFKTDWDGARARINKTVEDQTAGKIPDLFPAKSITPLTRVVLTNALYLKAAWAREFPRDKTKNEPFTRSDGSTVSVPMMRNEPFKEPKAPLGYAEGPGYQVVTLPYRGGKLAFTVIIPSSTEALRAKGIATVLSEVQPADVQLAMPKFTVRSAMDLKKTLETAGMPLAFSSAADFSGITQQEPLRLDSVQHKTFVQVDEEGTEAAAATGVDVQVVSAPVVRTVTVDRPFIFVITDTATGAPLFLGRVNDPTAG